MRSESTRCFADCTPYILLLTRGGCPLLERGLSVRGQQERAELEGETTVTIIFPEIMVYIKFINQFDVLQYCFWS